MNWHSWSKIDTCTAEHVVYGHCFGWSPQFYGQKNYCHIDVLYLPFLHQSAKFYAHIFETRMHSSRIRTARGSSCQLGVCLSACWVTPPLGVGLETPLWVWAWRHPQCGPSDPPVCGPRYPPARQTTQPPHWVLAWRAPGQTPQLPPRCGPGDPPGPTTRAPPWVWAWRPARYAGIPPARHAGIPFPPLWTEWQTGAKYTLPQTSFAGGKNDFANEVLLYSLRINISKTIPHPDSTFSRFPCPIRMDTFTPGMWIDFGGRIGGRTMSTVLKVKN